ncbi:MAG TPA: hypothetical protein EYG16_02535 [Deltaproteobacteria bacterium]|nr:hypothetical protein [Candidatus Binatota bacterium]HIL12531.1 hypothetical protein [Deltaproteobacteria bacterium]
MTGTVYHIAPIPPNKEHTTYVEAGTLRIGVEYRLLDDAELATHYTGDDMDVIQAATQGVAVEDNGVSIHIFGSDDGHEYLRFDMFEREPHYHYIEPSGEKQTIVDYDRAALGDMLTWTLNQLATRLPEMLRFAGGARLASTLDTPAITESLNKVNDLAREAEAVLRAQHN